jgi:hypothetical protein
MNTDTITDRVIAVDYRKSLADMVAAGNYDYVNPNITVDGFPVEDAGTKKYRAKLFEFGRYISSEDAVAAMEKEHFMPATHVHGLAFGVAFPDEQRKYPSPVSVHPRRCSAAGSSCASAGAPAGGTSASATGTATGATIGASSASKRSPKLDADPLLFDLRSLCS